MLPVSWHLYTKTLHLFFCGNKTQPEQMKRGPLCILTALTAALLSGCEKEHSPSPEFIGNDDISLVIQGSTKIKYIPETFQIGFNADRRQFRIHNDTMSEYYILTCSSMPNVRESTPVNQCLGTTADKGRPTNTLFYRHDEKRKICRGCLLHPFRAWINR